MTTQARSSVLIDWSVLQRIVGSNEKMRERLLASFVTESGHDLEALEAALDAHSFGAARAVAHQLRGAAKTVGALSLAETARTLEVADVYSDEQRLNDLRAELRAQVAAIHERIESLHQS
jgi:HPt (histidine-containing phosphotransfer) domain-containing protein